MRTVVVTGAGGYVGGQTAIHFYDQGWDVIGIDYQHPPKHLANSTYFSKFYVGPFDSKDALDIIKDSNPDAIVHCAGTSLVGPSKQDPRPYYENNFVATKTLVEYLLDNNIKTRLIFSSSAATYGEPVMPPCREEDPPLPLSPYGESKLMTEMMLQSYANAYDFDVVIFRYFNVCGADSHSRHGQAPGATHIIARVLGDIARAHLIATQCITGTYNLGTGTGYSNREIIDTALSVTDQAEKEINWGPSRPGDPAVLVGCAKKFSRLTEWKPTYNLDNIIQHAWNWYTREL